MLGACGRSESAGNAAGGMDEARGVTITRCDGYTLVEIANPWRKGEVLHTYVLVPRYADAARNSKETGEASGSTRHDDDGSATLKGSEEQPLPEDLPDGTVVRVPIERAVVYSSVHAGVMKELGSFSAVRGVCDAQYYTMPEVQSGIADGSIADCGNSLSPTIERLVALKPDAIILSPF